MSQLSGLYAIWLREVKVFFREYSRLIGSVLTPLLWLVVVGKGIGASIEDEESFGSYGYDTFIFPGILCMTVLFQSVFYGLYIVWDRKIDFLKEVLAAPLHRSTIFLGKVLGGVTDSMVQVTIIVILGYFIFPELRENYTVQSLARFTIIRSSMSCSFMSWIVMGLPVLWICANVTLSRSRFWSSGKTLLEGRRSSDLTKETIPFLFYAESRQIHDNETNTFFSIQLFNGDWISDPLHIGELDLSFLVSCLESLGLQQLIHARRDRACQ